MKSDKQQKLSEDIRAKGSEGRVFLLPIFICANEGTAQTGRHFLHTLLWRVKRVWRQWGRDPTVLATWEKKQDDCRAGTPRLCYLT